MVHKSRYAPPEKTISPLSTEVLYDESHGNAWSVRDTGFYGYSGFAKILVDHGIPVSRVCLPLDRTLKEYAGNAARKVLVLNVAKFGKYGPDELAAVEVFVRMGGALLCIGEHENIYGSSDFQNPMLRQFGMEFMNDFAGDIIPGEKFEGSNLTILNQKAVSVPFDLGNVCHLLSAPVSNLTGNSGYAELLHGYRKGKTVIIGAGLNYGKGRVAAVGDSELFWNGDGRIGIDAGDNRLFLERLFEWLLEGRLFPVRKDARCVFQQNAARTGKRIFIDISSHGVGINGSPDGLQSLVEFLRGRGHEVCAGDTCDAYDVRLVAAPLSKVVCPPEKKERLILLADSYQQITAYTDWGKMLFSLKALNPPSIYREVEQYYGVKIQPCFLTDGGIGKNYFDINFSYKSFQTLIKRAGSLDIQGSGLKKWLAPDTTVWGETVHPGVENKNQGIPMYDTTDVQTPILSAWDDRVLIILTSDILSNTRSSDAIFNPLSRAVESWIQSGRIE